MIKVCNFIQDDDKTREELIENAVICKTTKDDVFEIIRILACCFGIESESHAFMQLYETNANLKESVKVIDKRDGKIYGFLIFTESKISRGTPLFMAKTTEFIWKNICQGKKQLNGHSFILDSRLRGCGIDKQMLFFNKEFIQQYDYIWCGVERSLKSHNYWKKLGFMELFSIDDASFYVMPVAQKDLSMVFIINKILGKANEESYSVRKG